MTEDDDRRETEAVAAWFADHDDTTANRFGSSTARPEDSDDPMYGPGGIPIEPTNTRTPRDHRAPAL